MRERAPEARSAAECQCVNEPIVDAPVIVASVSLSSSSSSFWSRTDLRRLVSRATLRRYQVGARQRRHSHLHFVAPSLISWKTGKSTKRSNNGRRTVGVGKSVIMSSSIASAAADSAARALSASATSTTLRRATSSAAAALAGDELVEADEAA